MIPIVPAWIMTLAAQAATTPGVPCVSRSATAAASVVYLEAVTDSVVTVRVCLAPTTRSTTRIGVLRVQLRYDTTVLRIQGTTSGGRTMSIVRSPGALTVTGRGAIPMGTLASVRFRRIRGTTTPVSVRVLEATATNGRDLRSAVVARDLQGPASRPATAAASPAATTVHIDSIVPAEIDLLGAGIGEVMIHGRGFAAEGNQVLLDESVISTLVSADSRSMRLVVRRTVLSNGGPPRALMPGTHALQVRNGAGSSNTVSLKVQSP